MSASDDERRRLENRYRELPASELLRLYESRESGLSETAVELLRGELRLRGLDPDSLRPTVPKAIVEQEEGAAGDASLADDEPSRGEARAAPIEPADADAAASAAADPPPAPAGQKVRCAQCGAVNAAVEIDCSRCGAPLGEPERHQTMKRRITDPGIALPSKQPPGTVASATVGILGVTAIAMGLYALTKPVAAMRFVVMAIAIGALNLGMAWGLYRYAQRRKDVEEPAPN